MIYIINYSIEMGAKKRIVVQLLKKSCTFMAGFVGNTQNVKKVLTFRKTRSIIADINDEGVRNENLFLALFSIAGEYVMKEKEELVWM